MSCFLNSNSSRRCNSGSEAYWCPIIIQTWADSSIC